MNRRIDDYRNSAAPRAEDNDEVRKFLQKLVFGSVSDPLEAAYFRAYRDFNRTLRFGAVDTKAREALRTKVLDQLGTCISALKRYYSPEQEFFDQWHERTCYDIRGVYLSADIKFTFGQAQKWLNMTLKYLYVLGDHDLDRFLDLFHIPIDKYVIEIAARDLNIPCPKKRWSKWDDYTNEYMRYQLALRERIVGVSPFFWELSAWNDEADQINVD